MFEQIILLIFFKKFYIVYPTLHQLLIPNDNILHLQISSILSLFKIYRFLYLNFMI